MSNEPKPFFVFKVDWGCSWGGKAIFRVAVANPCHPRRFTPATPSLPFSSLPTPAGIAAVADHVQLELTVVYKSCVLLKLLCYSWALWLATCQLAIIQDMQVCVCNVECVCKVECVFV